MPHGLLLWTFLQPFIAEERISATFSLLQGEEMKETFPTVNIVIYFN